MPNLWTTNVGRIERYHNTPYVLRRARRSIGAIMELNDEVPEKVLCQRSIYPGM